VDGIGECLDAVVDVLLGIGKKSRVRFICIKCVIKLIPIDLKVRRWGEVVIGESVNSSRIGL